ncbi:MAG: SdiA-regulated domain-containing protein [candidate division KSB1 bacterium]|nr:SdiA-regulated domain-containing protein [candidate division KSB1 bacterium]MDZ7312900.1 SdiA-regulated domain-containing protein [candidate division KSB1 bacterium]
MFFILMWLGLGGDELPEIRGYDFLNKKVEHHKLPPELREASGLAFTQEGRLLCHDDEQGAIYEMDYRSGRIHKRFYLGEAQIYRDDLEGIATKGDTIFMVNSSGMILRFLPGRNEERVPFQRFKTPLAARNNVEGLAYDPVTDCLLLACKNEASMDNRNPLPADQKAVYAFSLKTYQLLPQPRLLISTRQITAKTGENEFSPSAIERHPRTGHFFVLAANGHAIIEMAEDGRLLGVSTLPKSVNPQPEGLAIAPDGTLVICNEGKKKDKAGQICIYPPR